MNHQIFKNRIALSSVLVTIITGLSLLILLASYSAQKKLAEDIFKQLGITKLDANSKITNSMLEGYLDGEGVKNIKNIMLGNRGAIAKDLLVYTKQYVNSPAFTKEYSAMRERLKPIMPPVKTPEQMQLEYVDNSKKSVAELEEKLKKADAATKPVLEKTLEYTRKALQQAEDPGNKLIASYRQGYPGLVKDNEAIHAKRIAEWEARYPANLQHFIRMRLHQFMEETAAIDFKAELYEKKGKKYFVNREYEAKSNRWKMAFRAGKEVVEPARAFVQDWILSIQ